MRKFLAVAALVHAAFVAGPSPAADLTVYTPPVPPADYNLGGSFYLRGSAAINLHRAPSIDHPEGDDGVIDTNQDGFGYSVGAGFGYETGSGLRFDATIDQLETKGLRITKDDGDPDDGDYTLMLRSTLALANVYYDFSLGSGGFGYTGNGAFAYVGAGAGVAWNHAEVNAPEDFFVPTGGNVSAAAAVMAGVGYDFGNWVADVGYRGVYINEINNRPTTGDQFYTIDNNIIHEVRGTVRYRFN